jgi:hypothetical protein
MADATTHETIEERHMVRTVITGSLGEGIAGGAAVALSIIGLANILSALMLSIATIAIGASLMFEGGSVAARFSDILSETTKGRLDAADLGIGMTAELIGGIAGLALGILALLNIYPMVLVPTAAIVFGGTLFLGSGVTAKLSSIEIARSSENQTFKEVSREAVSAAASVQLLIGLGAVTLGILSLIGMSPVTLSLVAMLGISFSSLLTGTAVSGRLTNIFRHQ